MRFRASIAAVTKWILPLLVAVALAQDGAPPSVLCSRALSREAASVFENDMLALAARVNVQPAPECPLLPSRSYFSGHEAAKDKLHPGLYQCKLCNKRFRGEHYADQHMGRAHPAAAHAVSSNDNPGAPPPLPPSCLADWCGLLGCPSLATDESGKRSGLLPADEVLAQMMMEDEEEEEEVEEDGEGAASSSGDGKPAAIGALEARRRRLALAGALAQNSSFSLHHARLRPSALSPAQARLRYHCLDVIAECFPLPSLEAVASAGAAGAAAVDSAEGGGGGRQALRMRMPPTSATVSDLRARLAVDFCDRPPAEKAGAQKAKRARAMWMVVAVAVASVVGIAGLAITLALCLDDGRVRTAQPLTLRRRRMSVGAALAAKHRVSTTAAARTTATIYISPGQAMRRRNAAVVGGGGGENYLPAPGEDAGFPWAAEERYDSGTEYRNPRQE